MSQGPALAGDSSLEQVAPDGMIVLSEYSDRLPPSASARDIAASTNAAVLAGCSVYYIPSDFDDCGDAEGALWHIPNQSSEALALWIGYIPSFDRYCAIYQAALNKGIRLLNTPEQHRIAQEFDHAYPHIVELTPETIFITSVDECDSAAQRLGFPIFVKGAVQSRKARGWKACVADTHDELQRLTTALLTLADRSRGRVALRKLMPLRHCRSSGQGFPFGREYRVFLFAQRVLGMGYYWEGDDPLKHLSSSEGECVRSLAIESSRRLNVPYVSIDVGQLEDGRWIVIETGDAQFSGVSQIPLLQLWNNIREELSGR
jgi:ATP-grasp domain, R2K clade family 3